MPYFMTMNSTRQPIIQRDDFWDDSWGDIVDKLVVPVDRGQKVGAKYFPLGGLLEEKVKVIPNLFSIEFWYCTELIKNTIEQLESGWHGFHPFSLRNPYEDNEITQLYIINIVGWIDAIDVERSDNLVTRTFPSGKEITRVSPLHLSKDKREIALHDDMIKCRHLWVSPKADGPGKAFVSDELHDKIKQCGKPHSHLDFYRTK
ncbi:imm11 family protein [Roseibium album]|uniref:imm11 family protein n=1 Tax=Roseibium album TaxID=311410 RepID=UPI00249069B2|nr:DUF1629 domain-containing protein [Roseibium album]